MKLAIALAILKTLTLSFEYQETSPASLFPYYNTASDDLPLGHLANPAYLPLWNTAYINIDYCKPYWMEELNSGNLRTGYGFNNLAFQASWNRFGIEEYREDKISGKIGYMPWEYISAGIDISYYYLYINTQELKNKQGLTDFNLSLLLLPFEWLNISYTHENIYTALNSNEKDLLYPNWSAGFSLKPVKGISFIWNTNRLDYGFLNSISISANMLSCLNLRAGYSIETSSYAASVIFQYRNLYVSYGLNHHSFLGLSHKFGITISASALSFEQLNYNEKLFRKTLPGSDKLLNINKCTYEELVTSEIFTETIADRIIKYRKIIGPITSGSLIQIGLTTIKVKEIKNKISGLADTSKSKKNDALKKEKRSTRSWKDKSRYIDIDKRKILFKLLLKNGFSASKALEISDLAKYKNITEFLHKVEKIKTITEKQKKIITDICRDIL